MVKLFLSGIYFEGYELNASHIGLLADLLQTDGQRQQDLAISTIKDKGTVARSLSTLESDGMIQRKLDPIDRRQKLIFLTDKGRRMMRFTSTRCQAMLAQASQDISEEALSTCTQVLQKIYYNLHEQLSENELISHE